MGQPDHHGARHEVDALVRKHNGKRNPYTASNPTRTAMSKKTAKTDIAALEYALADLTPPTARPGRRKARYLAKLSGTVKPTAVIDSGNGIQCLWRLQERIEVGEPVRVEKTKDSKTERNAVLRPEIRPRLMTSSCGLRKS